MATLQKFKILATQCATVAGSPSRSPTPTTSPVFQLRRRKTLRMLFTRSNANGSGSSSNRQLGFREVSIEDRRRRNVVTDPNPNPNPPQKNKNKNNNLLTSSSSSNKLKDLFVSSPSPPSTQSLQDNGKQRGIIVRDNGELIDRRSGSGGGRGGVIGSSSPRPFFSTFRYRLHRRSWRPVLVTISE